ncbi:MAG: hypothetical protein M1816_007959 [Peltula sp. TS41687]|nr:MAG: hypothetical protein M1816_007959 [Peltula sp. TS41687]
MDEISGYNGPGAPANIPQYGPSTTTTTTTEDISPEGEDGYNFDADLAMFTNTQFFDFDLGAMVDTAPAPYTRAKPGRDVVQQSRLGFLSDEYQFPDIPNYPKLLDGSAVVPPPIQTQNTSLYPTSSTISSPAETPSSNGAVFSPRMGEKRKAEAATLPASLEEASRLAAEEDKRRRNTAASARFRVKKKQREQTLERTAKEMTEKVARFETRIGQLETENKWLKNLITEKNENKDDVAELWRRFNKDGSSVLRRSSASASPVSPTPAATERKDGLIGPVGGSRTVQSS